MKTLSELSMDELRTLVNDLHALMWYGDGCKICAHKIVEQRSYTKFGCSLQGDCYPLWEGFAESVDDK